MTQQELCEPPTRANVPRPGETDPDVVAISAEELALVVVEWSGQSAEEWLPDILRLVEEGLAAQGGYRLAKRLAEDTGCEPDMELVEILDKAYLLLDKAHREAVKEWVSATKPVPKLPIGTTVRVVMDSEWRYGEITAIDLDEARYTVVIPGSGRFVPGLGMQRLRFEWERVERWNYARPL